MIFLRRQILSLFNLLKIINKPICDIAICCLARLTKITARHNDHQRSQFYMAIVTFCAVEINILDLIYAEVKDFF